MTVAVSAEDACLVGIYCCSSLSVMFSLPVWGCKENLEDAEEVSTGSWSHR